MATRDADSKLPAPEQSEDMCKVATDGRVIVVGDIVGKEPIVAKPTK